MTATRTPGYKYYVRQQFPSLRYQVVMVDLFQAMTMKARGEKVYDSSAQAYAVRDSLQKKRDEVHSEEFR